MFKPYKRTVRGNEEVVFNWGDQLLPDGDYFVTDCSENAVSTKYLGQIPLCVHSAKCRRYKNNVLPSHGFVDVVDLTFYCKTSSAQEGCSKTTWQNCAIDDSLPNEINIDSCMTERPSVPSAGCSVPERQKGRSGDTRATN